MADNRIIPDAADIAMHKFTFASARALSGLASDGGSAQSRDRSMDRLVVTYPDFLKAASAATFPSMKPRWMPVAPHARHLTSADARSREARPCLRYVGKT